MCDKYVLYPWAVCSVNPLTQSSPQLASGETNENPPWSTLAGKLSVLHPSFQSRSGGTAQPIWGFLLFPFRSLLRGVSGRHPGVPLRRQCVRGGVGLHPQSGSLFSAAGRGLAEWDLSSLPLPRGLHSSRGAGGELHA